MVGRVAIFLCWDGYSDLDDVVIVGGGTVGDFFVGFVLVALVLLVGVVIFAESEFRGCPPPSSSGEEPMPSDDTQCDQPVVIKDIFARDDASVIKAHRLYPSQIADSPSL